MNRSDLITTITEIVRDIADCGAKSGLGEINEDTPLYGQNGLFDSIGLVTVVATLEQEVSEKVGFPITIADERAMSQRRNPFLSVGSLASYTEELVNEAGER